MSRKVVVIDPDEAVRACLLGALQSADLPTAAFLSAGEFFDGCGPEGASCVVSEFSLPDMDGLTLQAELGAAASGVPVVFMTASGCVESAVAAMKGGAVDFLCKPVDERAIVDIVKHAISRTELLRLFEQEGRVVRRLAQLSAREREILELVVKGMSTKQIAFELGRVEKTVEFHRRNLMRKLGAGNVAELVRMVAVATMNPFAAHAHAAPRRRWPNGEAENQVAADDGDL